MVAVGGLYDDHKQEDLMTLLVTEEDVGMVLAVNVCIDENAEKNVRVV